MLGLVPCSRWPAALPWKARSTTVSPRLLGRDRARPAGPGRCAVRPGAAQARSLRRSTVRQSRIRACRGTERPLVRARGRWRVYDALPPATRGPIPSRGPSMRGTIATKRRHQRGIATDGPSQWRRPINHKVEPSEAMPGAVVCASHCWGTTCPSGPTASRATRHHALSTTFARRASRPARGHARGITKSVRTLPAAGRTTGSYISRISNEDVRCSAAAAKVSYSFKDRQGRVAKLLGNNVTRRCIFHPASLDLIARQVPRRRGRLRHAWIGETYKMSDRAVVTKPIVFSFPDLFAFAMIVLSGTPT